MFFKIKNIPPFVWILLKTFLITGFVAFMVSPFSCRISEEGLILIDENYSCPKIESFYVTDEKTARIVFDKKVSLSNYSIFPEVGIDCLKYENSENDEALCFVDILFSEELVTGENYNFYGRVKDKKGNSLTFSIPLLGYNSRVPELIMTEIHPKYTSGSNKTGKYFKCEFIELKVLSDGNLSGLYLYSAYDGEDKAYYFPALEVSAGEILIIHLRKKEDSAVNELGENIALSATKYSSDLARDLWAENENARLGDDMDVILLKNSCDGSVLDAFCYSSDLFSAWKNDLMSEAAEEASKNDCWKGRGIEDSFKFSNLTASKSFERIKSTNSPDSWILTASSGESPGIINMD